MPEPFTIDPDIARAWTLPARAYTDPAVFEAAKERVFARSWQFVGDEGEVRVPGQLKPFTLLEGCLNEPLLLTRDMKDQLHCLSNVCTHRGTILCEKGRSESGAGFERTLTCRYHGRRFDLDGTMKHMPEFQGVQGFPSEKDNLAKVAWGKWGTDRGGWLFASLSPRSSFEEVLGPVMERMSFLPLDRFVFDASRSRDYLVRANWALYCDNYLEGFHIPFVHAGLNEVLDYGEYAAEMFPWCNLQLGIGKSGEHCFELPRSSPDFGRGGRGGGGGGGGVAAYYWWVFPNLMLNFYPWGLSVNVVKPLGVDSTRVSFLSYVLDASKLDAGAGAGLDRVEREDESVVEAVQQGMRSRLYDRGRYSPTREQGVHHFHRLLASALFE
ncbi:choline monooxygenase [Phycisphaerales bacterium]|nr:choline monooxygenase [Phycisphaerales bacterium]